MFKGWFCNLNSVTMYLYFFAIHLIMALLLCGFITKEKGSITKKITSNVCRH